MIFIFEKITVIIDKEESLIRLNKTKPIAAIHVLLEKQEVEKGEKEQAPVEWSEDLEMPLDDSTDRLTLVLSNGEAVEKNVSDDLSFQIYDLLLPYFKK